MCVYRHLAYSFGCAFEHVVLCTHFSCGLGSDSEHVFCKHFALRFRSDFEPAVGTHFAHFFSFGKTCPPPLVPSTYLRDLCACPFSSDLGPILFDAF